MGKFDQVAPQSSATTGHASATGRSTGRARQVGSYPCGPCSSEWPRGLKLPCRPDGSGQLARSDLADLSGDGMEAPRGSLARAWPPNEETGRTMERGPSVARRCAGAVVTAWRSTWAATLGSISITIGIELFVAHAGSYCGPAGPSSVAPARNRCDWAAASPQHVHADFSRRHGCAPPALQTVPRQWHVRRGSPGGSPRSIRGRLQSGWVIISVGLVLVGPGGSSWPCARTATFGRDQRHAWAWPRARRCGVGRRTAATRRWVAIGRHSW